MANIELLDKAIQSIKDHPENWDQNQWAEADADGKFAQEELSKDDPELLLDGTCGTSFCLAGHVAIVNGAKFKWYPKYNFFRDRVLSYGAEVELPDGGTQDIEDYARQALGLDYDNAAMLFYHTNNLEDLEDYRDKLANGEEL